MSLSDEAREARKLYQREYHRRWRQLPESKEKIKKYNDRYWEKQASIFEKETKNN